MKPHKLITLISLTTFAAAVGLACGQEPSPAKSDQAPGEELTIDVYSFPTFERDGGAIQEMDFATWLHGLKEGKRTDDPSRPRVFHRAFALSDAPLTLKAIAQESKGSDPIAIEGTVTPMADNRAKVDFSKLGSLTLPPAKTGEDRQPVATSLTIREGEWRVLRLPLVQTSSEGRFWNLETIVRLHLVGHLSKWLPLGRAFHGDDFDK